MDWLKGLNLRLDDVRFPESTDGLIDEMAASMWLRRVTETLPDHQDAPDFFEDVSDVDRWLWRQLACVAYTVMLTHQIEMAGGAVTFEAEVEVEEEDE